ncbi:MAG: NAD-dependent deacylase [Chloroflexi bacterium]|nr:NAD-dependent deacylase [Chloroflexota bacterium]
MMGHLELARIIQNAEYLVVLTGAGISTPSGIPDFRSDKGGLWARVDPMEVASLSAFRTNPQRFFEWMRPLAVQIIGAKPNPAHYALAEIEEHGIRTTIITQNIDGLHQKAGSTNVLEVHGTLNTLTCVHCSNQRCVTDFMDALVEELQMPRCPQCGHILKPDVILYEEQLPVRIWQAAEKAVADCDVLMVAGSSLEVLPVAGLPLRALEHGANLIVINQSETFLDDRAAEVVRDDLAEALPRIANEIG